MNNYVLNPAEIKTAEKKEQYDGAIEKEVWKSKGIWDKAIIIIVIFLATAMFCKYLIDTLKSWADVTSFTF